MAINPGLMFATRQDPEDHFHSFLWRNIYVCVREYRAKCALHLIEFLFPLYGLRAMMIWRVPL